MFHPNTFKQHVSFLLFTILVFTYLLFLCLGAIYWLIHKNKWSTNIIPLLIQISLAEIFFVPTFELSFNNIKNPLSFVFSDILLLLLIPLNITLIFIGLLMYRYNERNDDMKNKHEWMYPSNRTDFKLKASKWILEKAQKIDNIAGGEGHFFIQIALDCFLAEIIGAKDSLLQEINEYFELNLPINEVTLDKINSELNKEGYDNKIILNDLNKISDKDYWLWRLNEYRTHSIHRNIIPREIEGSAGSERYMNVYLTKIPLDSNGDRGPEIISYMKESYKKMEELIQDTRKIPK